MELISIVTIKNVTVEDGVPKTCVPITANTREEVLAGALGIVNSRVDIVEWHVDWFESTLDIEKMKDVLEQLSSVLNQIPLLFTLRTAKGDDKIDLSSETYLEINQAAAATDRVNLIDVKVLDKETIATKMIEGIHAADVKVVGSNHQFDKTPSQEEIVDRLRRIQKLGADIYRIVVMPQSKTSVIRLLEAVSVMHQKYAEKPLVTISMAKLGVVSHVTGEIFGPALTFGTAKKVSAPGRIESETLYQILQDIHKVL